MARSAMRVWCGPRRVDIIWRRAICTLVNILVKKGKYVIDLLRTFQRKEKWKKLRMRATYGGRGERARLVEGFQTQGDIGAGGTAVE